MDAGSNAVRRRGPEVGLYDAGGTGSPTSQTRSPPCRGNRRGVDRVSESSARKKNPQQHTSHDDDVYDPREAALRGPANAVERAAFWEWMLRQFWPLFVEEGHVHREGLDAALADADTQFAEMKKADEAWPAIAQARIREWEK